MLLQFILVETYIEVYFGKLNFDPINCKIFRSINLKENLSVNVTIRIGNKMYFSCGKRGFVLYYDDLTSN